MSLEVHDLSVPRDVEQIGFVVSGKVTMPFRLEIKRTPSEENGQSMDTMVHLSSIVRFLFRCEALQNRTGPCLI